MLDRLSKNVQGVVYQFLEPLDVLKLELVCKKVSAGARQDYIWRYLAERTLPFYQKFYKLTWKQVFCRNVKASNRLTKKISNYDYSMCPIRHFKKVVKHVDAFQGFVFAADCEGQVSIFLISEEDPENDDETMKSWDLQTAGVEFLKYVPDLSALVIVTSDARILTIRIEQDGPDQFRIVDTSDLNLDMKISNLYVTQMSEQYLFISNYPFDSEDFFVDQAVVIYDFLKGNIFHKQELQLLDPSSVVTEHFNKVFGVIMRQPFIGQPPRMVPQGGDAQVSLFKEDRHLAQLAVFNGDRLAISLYNRHFAVIDTQMSKLDLFLKKTNVSMIDPFGNPNIPLPVNMRLYAGTLVTFNLNQICVIDYNLMTFKFSLGTQPHLNTKFTYTPVTNSLVMLGQQESNFIYYHLQTDFANKNLKFNQELNIPCKKTVTDIDMNRFMIANANADAEVQIYNLQRLTDPPIYITCGSKTIKSYLPHPRKAGVSLVKVTQSKVIAALGNLLRVYSFDVE